MGRIRIPIGENRVDDQKTRILEPHKSAAPRFEVHSGLNHLANQEVTSNGRTRTDLHDDCPNLGNWAILTRLESWTIDTRPNVHFF